MPKQILQKMRLPQRLPRQLQHLGAVIGGAGAVGGAAAVVGVSGAAFVLHKLQQVRCVNSRDHTH